MKILYVSDNRCRANYGCRATSIALSQLIAASGNIITGRISGQFTNHNTGNIFFWEKMPKCIYGLFSHKLCSKILKKIFIRYVFPIFRKSNTPPYCNEFDVVSLDLDRSILNIKKSLALNPSLREFDLDQYDYDTMIVNGEGSFIFSDPEWLWRESVVLLVLMHWAQKRGKKVFFMNAMFSDSPYYERNYRTLSVANTIFSKCAAVVVREHYSYEYAKKYMPDVKPILFPDALFTWYDMVNGQQKITNIGTLIPFGEEFDESFNMMDFRYPYILVAGSSSQNISNDINKTISAYENLLMQIKSRYSGAIYLIHVCEGDNFLKEVSRKSAIPIISIHTPILGAAKIISNAQVFISGRYHPSIMASLGGCPCVFMKSNSHKNSSLQELLQYPEIKEFCEVPNDEEIEGIVTLAMKYVEMGDVLRKRIQERALNLSLEARGMTELWR